MLSRFFLACCILTLSSCGEESSGTASNPGPLVDNTQWVPTEAGDEFFGPPPEDAECELMPINCPEFPWPEGECVSLVGSSCVTAFVPECLDQFTVLAVYTRMPNPSEPLCNWLTLEQPSLRRIRAGDRVEIRTRHATLTAPLGSRARMSFVIGNAMALDYEVEIAPPPGTAPFFPSETWTASTDYPAGTRLLFHVDNHGSNEYMLIEVNILGPAEAT